jgi:hypothetical protein
MKTPSIHPENGEGPDARQRSEPSDTETTQKLNCAPAEPNAQAVSAQGSSLASATVEKMVKANELAIVLLLQAEEEIDQAVSCSCCESITAKPLINPRVIVEPDRWVVAFICPKCENETNNTDGDNIKRISLIDVAQVDATLLAAYKWLDGKLLQKNGWKLFIRRPTFAECQKALATSAILPAGAAVVVTLHGENHLLRRLMPMPFPWRDEQEWMAGPIAAQDALDLADAIERGEVDMLEVGGNAIFFSSSETLGRLAGSAGGAS